MAWNIIYAPAAAPQFLAPLRASLTISGFPPRITNSGLSANISPHSTPLNFIGSIPGLIPPLTALWPDPLPDGILGSPYDFFLTASGGTPPYTYSTDTAGASLLASLGITLNAATGELSSSAPLSVSASFASINFFVADIFG